MGAAHDIARLCAEVTLRWRAFLHHTSDRPHVHHALAARHHALRFVLSHKIALFKAVMFLVREASNFGSPFYDIFTRFLLLT